MRPARAASRPSWLTMSNSGRANLPHEEAIRDFLREGTQPVEVVDVTGMPWIEIDFPADVERAERDILPRLS